jgi:hypothetical protein
MTFSSNFFKTTSICAFVSGVLFVIIQRLLWTSGAPMNADELVAIMRDRPTYTWHLWGHFINEFFVIIVFWAVTAKKIDKAAGLVTTGFFFAFASFVFFLLSLGIRLFALAKAIARLDPIHAVLTNDLILSLSGVVYVLILSGLICSLIAFLLYGIATWNSIGIEKAVSVFFFANFICFIFYLIGLSFAQDWFSHLVIRTVYIVTAITMFIIAGWLWKGKEPA